MFTQKGSFIMKKSRTFRKSFVVAIAALCLAAPLAVMPVQVETSYADGAETTTTTYKAYQIFSGTLDGDNVLGDIKWGVAVNLSDEEALKNAIKQIPGFGDISDAKSVAKVLGTTNDNSDVAKSFAKVIEKFVITNNGEEVEADKESTVNKGAGYYLVRTETVAENDVRTSFILEVVNSTINFTTKNASPTVVKKVMENTDVSDYSGSYLNYNDVADYNIGDKVPFLLEATLPTKATDFDSYSAYYLRFTDTLANGLTVDASSIKIFVNGTEVTTSPYNVHKDISGQTLIVTIEDVNALDGVSAGSKIAVKYDAKLNSDAVIGGAGNENAVYLEYSNNPNYDYNPKTNGPNAGDGVTNPETPKDQNNPTEEETFPETPDVPNDNPSDDTPKEDNTGKTPTDKVIVFTYQIDITKYLESATAGNEASAGLAGFQLTKMVGSDTYVAILDSNRKLVRWEKATIGEDEKITNANSEIKTDSDGKVCFIGVDEGTYTIIESTTPNGYNTLEPKTITITADTRDTGSTNGINVNDLRQTWNGADPASVLASLSCEGAVPDKSNGSVAMEIINNRGSSLPSTGGIGTTIFYLGGGTMAAVAGVYLITKKRMKNEEDDEI